MIELSSGIVVLWERGNWYVEQCRVVKVRIIHFLVTHNIWMLQEHKRVEMFDWDRNEKSNLAFLFKEKWNAAREQTFRLSTIFTDVCKKI